MNKLITFTLTMLLLFAMTSSAYVEAAEGINTSDILIAYFTMPETDSVDAVSGASRVVEDNAVIGNVEYIAKAIQQATGGNLFLIETVQTYPASHDPLLQFAREEMEKDARPELSAQLENLDDYDFVFLGYPNWWADLPMPLYTFLDEYDLSGKTIIPFCPHGGSGFSNTVNTIAQLEPGAIVSTEGFTISRNDVPGSTERIIAWVEALNLDALALQ